MSELIKQARELCEEATPGPWVRVDTPDYAEIHVEGTGPDGSPLSLVANSDNADLIATSRTIVPQLCDALKAAEKEIGRLIDLSGDWKEAADQYHAERNDAIARAEKAEAERDTYKAALQNWHEQEGVEL